MARVDAYLSLIDDPTLPPLQPGDPADPVLHGLLVHLAFSDGVVEGDEFALLQRIRPDLDPGALLTWAMEASAAPFDPQPLLAVAPTEEERWNVLRFAARMVCLDGDVASSEIEVLRELALVLQLPDRAPRRVVDEVVARGGRVSPARVALALRSMLWRRLVPDREDLSGDLVAVVPDDVEAVCRLCLDEAEVAGVFKEGLVGRFDHGPAFVRWDQIGSYTRVPVPGAGFHLRTRNGVRCSMSDHRLADVGALLDFLFER